MLYSKRAHRPLTSADNQNRPLARSTETRHAEAGNNKDGVNRVMGDLIQTANVVAKGPV